MLDSRPDYDSNDNAIHLSDLCESRKEQRKKNRAAIFTKFGGVCVYCQSPKPTTVEHIRPRSTHPHLEHYWGNLAPCCAQCNTSRGCREWKEWFRSKPFYDLKREREILGVLQEWNIAD